MLGLPHQKEHRRLILFTGLGVGIPVLALAAFAVVMLRSDTVEKPMERRYIVQAEKISNLLRKP